MMLNDLKAVLKCKHRAGKPKKKDGFQEVRSRKPHATDAEARTLKNAALLTTSVAQKNEVATRNFFAPYGRLQWTRTPQYQSPRLQR
jgi:hypothetical protein